MDAAVESLKIHFGNYGLPATAQKWLLDLWHVIQVLDDFADGDPVTIEDRNRAVACIFGDLPANPFYLQNQTWLLPIVSSMATKWMASDNAERNKLADERSFVWRAGFYDVVSMVCGLVHGHNSDVAQSALALYGEDFREYKKEFKSA